MTQVRRRGPKTDIQDRIIDAAELLFGAHGFEGVSLREIGTRAGSSNKFAVQYHFKDKRGLAHAIFRRRLPAIEARRKDLLDEAQLAGRSNHLPTLIHVLLQPIVETIDASGSRRFAAFLLRTLLEGRAFRTDVDEAAPVAKRVEGLLHASMEQIPLPLFRMRLVVATMMFLSALVARDDSQIDRLKDLPEEVFLKELYLMVCASLLGEPVPD